MIVLFIFASRSRPRQDRYLYARVALLCLGAGLGLAGMLLDLAWVIWIAMAALLGGLALRHLRARGRDADEEGVEPL